MASPSRLFAAALAACLLPTAALTGPRVEGTRIRIHYGDQGTWNDRGASAGFQAYQGDRWVEWTWWGAPFAMWRLGWDDGGSSPEDWYGNANTQQMNAEILRFDDLSNDTHRVARHHFRTGYVQMRKTEAWLRDGSVLLTHIYVDNTDNRTLRDLRFLFAVDPDPDTSSGTANTNNDVIDTSADGRGDTAVSVGPNSGHAMAFRACAPARSELGHFGGWTGPGRIDQQLFDRDGAAGDEAMGIRVTADEPVPPGRSAVLTFLVGVGDTLDDALDHLDAAASLCMSCDRDGDGWLSPECGGEDCDDRDPTVYPGAPDTWYDGVDSDCDGWSDFDQDRDGFDSADHARPDGTFGPDCDDLDPEINPAAREIWYDGVDQDCDGLSDYDQDKDGFDSAGHGGDDCNDVDPTVYPGAPDPEGDGVDRDCDGCDGVCDTGDDGSEVIRGGCGCSAIDPIGAGYLLLALALGPVMRRRRR
jgi:uncharacterized protein (TIGR03382 family)